MLQKLEQVDTMDANITFPLPFLRHRAGAVGGLGEEAVAIEGGDRSLDERDIFQLLVHWREGFVGLEGEDGEFRPSRISSPEGLDRAAGFPCAKVDVDSARACLYCPWMPQGSERTIHCNVEP